MVPTGQKLGANEPKTVANAAARLQNHLLASETILNDASHTRSVVFVLDDSGFSSADLAEPEMGNPAIGGTEFNFVSLAYELTSRGIARTILIHRNQANVYPKILPAIRVNDYPNQLAEVLNRVGPIDCVVVRGHDSLPRSRVNDYIPEAIPIIAWAHNHLKSSTCSYLAACQKVKRVVYVGAEQCALSAGAPCHYKSSYIPNGLYMPPNGMLGKQQRAVYVGHLVPEKGFHRVARLWRQVRRTCASAELDVIGSSQVYQPEERLGPWKVASRQYEKRIRRYLGDYPEQHGVFFHGKLGTEKYRVMARASVGLPNPTGYTECCPGSVLEMSGCGAAVVAMRQWGMCDTLVDQVTGFLCRDEREYVRRVAYLLENPETAQLMGVAGHQFVRNFFSYDCVCEQWARVFAEVSTSALPSDVVPAIRGRYPFRMLRAMNGKWHCTKLHALISFFDRIRGAFLKRY